MHTVSLTGAGCPALNEAALQLLAAEPRLQPGQSAPPEYYQSNLLRAVEFVLERYAAVLPKNCAESLQQFVAANADSQRLLARLLTRKGPYFLYSSLGYTEVADLEQALLELAERGLITMEPGPADALLQTVKKQHLCHSFNLSNPQRGLSKVQIVEYILGRYSDLAICRRIATQVPWVRLKHPEHWRLARFLFFGTSGRDWSTFVLNDLGQTRFEVVPLGAPLFAGAEGLATLLAMQGLQRASYRLDDFPLLAEALLKALKQSRAGAIDGPRLHRCALRLGKWAEQRQQFDLALSAYKLAKVPPARERRVRILSRKGDAESASKLLQHILDQPRSAKERVFAERFGRRGAGFQPDTTVMPFTAMADSVEGYVLDKLLQGEGWGLHCENALFKSFTGLLYWPIIFAAVEDAFTNPFQSGPHDLFAEDFCHRRRELLLEHEDLLADDASLAQFLATTLQQKQGVANRLVSWSLFETVPLELWLSSIPAQVIRVLCAFLLRNLNDYRTGFPDLFLCYAPGEFEFIEVKGPGDQLQPQQRAWFQILMQLELPARVVKLQKS